MAGKRNGGGGREMVLGSRHVVGLFLVIVVISGIVFTLGYILGRNQYETQVRAATLPGRESARDTAEPVPPLKSATGKTDVKPGANLAVPPPASSDWDFYKSAAPRKPAGHLEKAAPSSAPATGKPAAGPSVASNKPGGAPAASNSKPADAKGNRALLNAPLIPRGAIVLQVAALTQEADALAIAQTLQKKNFPSFVLTPTGDHYYRVQVGPYADAQSAKIAQKGLEKEGFKAIVKH